MNDLARPRPTTPPVRPAARDGSRALAGLCALAFLLGLARLLLLGWDAPLWLDEVFTGVLATRPDLAGLVRDILRELGGPVYYGVIWSWEKLFGAGNAALRAPSVLFSIAAPVLVALRGPGDRTTRLFWAALLAVWLPGLDHGNEARPYALVILLATAQLLLFMRLLAAPGTGRATAWAAASALFVLTHYHALVVSGLQGLAFLALHRGRAFRTWPAAWPFALMAGWMALQIPLHLRFVDPDIAWQPLLGFADVRRLPELLTGGGRLATLLIAALLLTTAYDLYRWRRGKPFPYGRTELLAVGASLLGLLFVWGLGFVRPSFTYRYALPFMPGVLLGIALWALHWRQRFRFFPHLVLGCFLTLFAQDAARRLAEPRYDRRWVYSWEATTPFLRERNAERLLFLWDNPTAALAETEVLARVGGFFLKRENDPLPVSALILAGRPGDPDPTAALLARTPERGDAFIWAFDRDVRGTLAIARPPRLGLLRPDYDCRDFGGARNVVILACVRMR